METARPTFISNGFFPRVMGEYIPNSDISRVISNAAYQAYEKKLFREIMAGPIPKHIAVIMDGNRRFAAEMGLETADGHVKGRDKLEEVIDWCHEVSVKVLTVYAFSTENINRNKDEVDTLMKLFSQNFYDIGDDERIHKYKIRVQILGQKELLPKYLQKAINYAEDKTKQYSEYYLNIAVAYGSRQEMLDAIKSIAKDVKDNKLKIDDIDEKVFASKLYTGDMPDPDLILRTSGEVRLSNFLLWQVAYSELYFTDVYWPGFRKIDFLRAIRSYQLRQRRFGK
jgi:tritrans,polycis-undecaprenyl-diphosphate synthase [geranylgeranyl-diphosphate specific]